MIVLPDSAVEAIRRHGRESYRDEACGVLYGNLEGDARLVARAAPMVNSRQDERHRRFVVTAEDYRRAEAEAKKSGLELLGFYHSHPDHPAYPSPYDLEHAFPFFSYVILSVGKGEPDEMRSFVLSEDRSEFREEALQRGDRAEVESFSEPPGPEGPSSPRSLQPERSAKREATAAGVGPRGSNGRERGERAERRARRATN